MPGELFQTITSPEVGFSEPDCREALLVPGCGRSEMRHELAGEARLRFLDIGLSIGAILARGILR